jgi:hypothetical protein
MNTHGIKTRQREKKMKIIGGKSNKYEESSGNPLGKELYKVR